MTLSLRRSTHIYCLKCGENLYDYSQDYCDFCGIKFKYTNTGSYDEYLQNMEWFDRLKMKIRGSRIYHFFVDLLQYYTYEINDFSS